MSDGSGGEEVEDQAYDPFGDEVFMRKAYQEIAGKGGDPAQFQRHVASGDTGAAYKMLQEYMPGAVDMTAVRGRALDDLLGANNQAEFDLVKGSYSDDLGGTDWFDSAEFTPEDMSDDIVTAITALGDAGSRGEHGALQQKFAEMYPEQAALFDMVGFDEEEPYTELEALRALNQAETPQQFETTKAALSPYFGDSGWFQGASYEQDPMTFSEQARLYEVMNDAGDVFSMDDISQIIETRQFTPDQLRRMQDAAEGGELSQNVFDYLDEARGVVEDSDEYITFPEVAQQARQLASGELMPSQVNFMDEINNPEKFGFDTYEQKYNYWIENLLKSYGARPDLGTAPRITDNSGRPTNMIEGAITPEMLARTREWGNVIMDQGDRRRAITDEFLKRLRVDPEYDESLFEGLGPNADFDDFIEEAARQ
jgi:hypothetical protein